MIKKILHYTADKILPPLLILVAFYSFSSVAFGALTKTPTSLAPADRATLRAQLLASDTGATLDPVKKWVNGVRVSGCFNSPAAFILIEDDLGRREWASYDSKSCDSDNVTTLSGMRRGLSPTNPSFSAGTGLQFDAGAVVSVNDYTVFTNYAVYKDISTNLSGSGMIRCTGTSQGCIAVGNFTTAQRDAFTHNSGSTIIRNTTLDAIQFYNGTTWLSLAVSTGSFINATESTAGKVTIATLKDQSGSVVLDANGSPNVVGTQYLTSTGGLASQYGKITTLGRLGTLTGTILGTSYSGTSQTGSFLRMDGRWADPLGSGLTRFACSASTGSTMIVSTDGTTNFSQNCLIAYSKLTTGSVINIQASGTNSNDTDATSFILRVSSTQVCSIPVSPTGGGGSWHFVGTIKIRKHQRLGNVIVSGTLASKLPDPAGTEAVRNISCLNQAVTVNTIASTGTTIYPAWSMSGQAGNRAQLIDLSGQITNQ